MRPSAALAVLLVARAAAAQDAPALCGTARLHRTADGWSVEGVVGATPLAATVAPTMANATFGTAGGRVAVASTDSAALVVTCLPNAAPVLAWQGATTWQGEDVGMRTRRRIDWTHGGVTLETTREGDAPCGFADLPAEIAHLDATGYFVRSLDATLRRTAQSSWTEIPADAMAPVSVVGCAPGARALASVTLRGADGSIVARRGSGAMAFADGDGWFARLALGPAGLRHLELTSAARALPTRWLLSMEPGPVRRRVTLSPETLAQATGTRRVRITVPHVDHPTCISLVALAPGEVAAITAVTTLDEAGDGGVASLLAAADGPDGDAALALLLGLGEPGRTALVRSLGDLGPVAARRAARALARTNDAASLTAVARLLGRADTAAAAEEALVLAGAPALAALASVLPAVPRALRVLAAMRVSWGARLGAATALLGASDDAWHEGLPTLRAMLAGAAREGAVASWAQGIADGEPGLSRGLRVAAEAVATDDAALPALSARARTAWSTATDFGTRWRLLAALGGDAPGLALLGAVATGDEPAGADAELRVEACHALARFDGTSPSLLRALRDASPRVRTAAAAALRGRADAVASLRAALADDTWPSVRAAAAASLGPRAEAADALFAALDAHTTVVVRAALRALAVNPSPTVTARLGAFARDVTRASTLRREAVDALALRCDRAAGDGLESIANTVGDAALPPYEQEVAHAALAALARIDGARARAFLARSEANAEARAAVERAARGGCSAP